MHHTGIKTKEAYAALINVLYFNCTIQELKLHVRMSTVIFCDDFNCTIQELKRDPLLDTVESDILFQLHHTGIKTLKTSPTKTAMTEISIAPYRN